MSITDQDIISSAMSVARDAAEGRLDPAALQRELLAEMSRVLDTDAEPGSELAALQVSVCRRVLARGGIPASEVAEWLAVARSRAGGTDTPPESPTRLSIDLHGE